MRSSQRIVPLVLTYGLLALHRCLTGSRGNTNLTKNSSWRDKTSVHVFTNSVTMGLILIPYGIYIAATYLWFTQIHLLRAPSGDGLKCPA